MPDRGLGRARTRSTKRPRQEPARSRACVFRAPGGLADGELGTLNEALERAGLAFVGSCQVEAKLLADAGLAGSGTSARLLVYYGYTLSGSIRRDAPLWLKAMRALRGRRFGMVLLTEDDLDRLRDSAADLGALLDVALRGDRDLDLVPGETFVRDLSGSRKRASSVWLVERGGERLVRKAFGASYAHHLRRELLAREAIRAPGVQPIVERRGHVIYMRYLEGYRQWSGGLFAFVPRAVAIKVFGFLGEINRAGYSMVDINPDAFLWNDAGELRVVDFEYFAATRPAASVETSADFLGDFPGIDAPRRTGYRRFWRDAAGVPYAALVRGSTAEIAARRVLHIIVRIPWRAGLGIERTARAGYAAAVVSLRLRAGRLFV